MEDDWHSLLVTERHARIVAALERFRGETSLYLDPEIPPNKLANARETTQIPPTERVLGLLDCTVFGSAKNAVVFGETAIYYHNGWTMQDRAGRSQIDYGAFAKLPLHAGSLDIRFPGGAIETSGSSFSTRKMLELFSTLQRSVLRGLDDDRRPALAATIPSHFVDRTCLEPSNELWPCGIGTNADASVIVLPLVPSWAVEVNRGVMGAAIVRDFVIAVVNRAAPLFGAMELVGFELTSGREFWRRELAMVNWSGPIAAHGLVFVRGGAYWYAFDIETGEPRSIDVASLSRSVRDQLVLADAHIEQPETYATFAAELIDPASADTPPPLCAANSTCRVHVPFGDHEYAPALRIVDRRGTHHLRGAARGRARRIALTERHVFAVTDDTMWIADHTADPPIWVSTMAVSTEIFFVLAVGSDHVVTAGIGWMRCYRSS